MALSDSDVRARLIDQEEDRPTLRRRTDANDLSPWENSTGGFRLGRSQDPRRRAKPFSRGTKASNLRQMHLTSRQDETLKFHFKISNLRYQQGKDLGIKHSCEQIVRRLKVLKSCSKRTGQGSVSAQRDKQNLNGGSVGRKETGPRLRKLIEFRNCVVVTGFNPF